MSLEYIRTLEGQKDVLVSWITGYLDEIKHLNLALDLSISKATGKKLDDPKIQEHKQILINQVKEKANDK